MLTTPPNVTAPCVISNPLFWIGIATLPLLTVSVPTFTRVPLPAIVALVAVTAPDASTTRFPETERLLAAGTESVCTPVPPPIVSAIPLKFTSSVTVYVPFSAITTESAAIGARPRLQLPAVLHVPPATFVHELAKTLAVMLNAALVAPVSPGALAAIV